jgi:hypothetical protein
MSHPYYHARSSARKWGGDPADYQPIHDWFDATKAHLPDLRHRALRHHSEGIFLAEQVFGTTITNSSGRAIPVRQVGEQHVLEDLGRIPTAADWLRELQLKPWMLRKARLGQESLAEAIGDRDSNHPESPSPSPDAFVIADLDPDSLVAPV